MNGRVVLGFVVVAALAGCADLLGFKPLHQADSGTPDALAPDGGDESGCARVTFPGQPTTSASGTAGAYTLALHHVHFTTEDDGGVGSFGFDLDNHCTVDAPTASCKASGVVTDGVGGVDNESIQLLNALIGLQPTVSDSLSDPAVNATVDEGGFTLLVRVFGLRSDVDQPLAQGLTVAVQTSPGIASGVPTWQGHDIWQVAASDVVGGLDGGSNTPLKTFGGYVSGGVLVAQDPGPISLTVILPTGNTLTGAMPIRLTHVVLTGTLVKRSDSNYDITNGTIAGRWSSTDLLTAVANLNLSNAPLCESLGGGVYQAVLNTVCPKRDISSSGVDDGTAACDAVSVAMRFDAVAADIASDPSPTPVSTTPCADAGPCAD